MTFAVRAALTLLIFFVVLALVVVRPRGLNEAWWTGLGATAVLALRLVSPQQAVQATLVGKDALLLLLALLLLSLFLGHSGFFDWAAIWCARAARGDGRALFRNAFLLGTVVTVTLSLDTTAVILTPVVLAIVRRLKLPALPYVALCAFVANIGSLLLPISNLTNILFASAFGFSFASFALHLVLPQTAALLVTYVALRRYFRADLPNTFDVAELPEPASVVPNRTYFLACVSVLALVLLGYFVVPRFGLPAYSVAFAGVLVLGVVGALTRRLRLAVLAQVSWGVFPFVVGLFVTVKALENLGIAQVAAHWLARPALAGWAPFAVVGGSALAANLANNLPAALMARSVLLQAHAPLACIFGALIGVNAGSIITPFGSLATMLVLGMARREGEDIRPGRLMAIAVWLAPLVVLVSALTLVATIG